ncbi:MAG TPA: hypothetical protein PKN26_07765, partial [Giesbergeria sp.]|nr:hypothetical protein [Giesbergeria sp.]HNN16629.1 hypothetical protein [Giesbergeria sp.]HNN89321.1 hypothetical protein [Giesbergeria sp.]HNQ09764.1 hypothetical protein [Giesbergeria sp.]
MAKAWTTDWPSKTILLSYKVNHHHPHPAIFAPQETSGMATTASDTLIIGGGLAGIVTALELLRAG